MVDRRSGSSGSEPAATRYATAAVHLVALKRFAWMLDAAVQKPALTVLESDADRCSTVEMQA
jgi:hypothetical protein